MCQQPAQSSSHYLVQAPSTSITFFFGCSSVVAFILQNVNTAAVSCLSQARLDSWCEFIRQSHSQVLGACLRYSRQQPARPVSALNLLIVAIIRENTRFHQHMISRPIREAQLLDLTSQVQQAVRCTPVIHEGMMLPCHSSQACF